MARTTWHGTMPAPAVVDPPLHTPACAMPACTAAPAEAPRLPSAVLPSPLALLWVLRGRFAAVGSRSRGAGEDPYQPLAPVGVLLRE